MTVIDLRGRGSPGESLARIGTAIGGVISKIKGPDAADRRAFLGRVLGDPELLEEFGSIARNSPKALPKFLKAEDIEILKSTLPSLDELREDIARPGLTPEAVGGELPPEISTALSEFSRAGDVGATPAQLALESKRVKAAGEITQEDVTAGLRRKVTGLTPGQTAQDTLTADLFNTTKGIIDELPVEEKEKIALRAAIPSALLEGDRILAHKNRIELAQMRIDAQNLERANERTDAFRRSVGARWTERTKTGTPETWELFLFTQEMNERGKGLATGTILPQNQTDIRLMEIANAFSRADQVDKITEEGSVKTQIGVLIGRINRKDSKDNFANERSVRLVLLEQLNNSIAELASLTDGRISLGKIDKSKLDIIPFFGPGNLPLTFEGTTAAPTQPGQREIGQQRDQDVIDFLNRAGQEEQTEEIGELNPQTVDVSQLSSNDRDNLVRLMSGEGTMEELLRDAPLSAQRILDARRNR